MCGGDESDMEIWEKGAIRRLYAGGVAADQQNKQK